MIMSQVLKTQRETQLSEGIYVARGEALGVRADQLGLQVQEIGELLVSIKVGFNRKDNKVLRHSVNVYQTNHTIR